MACERVGYSPLNENAVEYAISATKAYVDELERRAVCLNGKSILEIGPGAEFASALVLASYGASVTLADRFLAPWDAEFHPHFYREFLLRWEGPKSAIEAVIKRGGYEGVLRLLSRPAESLEGISGESIDLVLSNAVLEHLSDLPKAIREMARITRPGGVHSHQVDCRDHRNFARPLDHLLIPEAEFSAERERTGCVRGTQTRLQEILEAFVPFFWVDAFEPNSFADTDYLNSLMLHRQERIQAFSVQSLRVTGGRLWLSKKRFERRNMRFLNPKRIVDAFRF